MKTIPMMEARTVALLTGLAIGFGLAFHPLFFVVAAGIVLVATTEWTINELRKFLIVFRQKQPVAHLR